MHTIRTEYFRLTSAQYEMINLMIIKIISGNTLELKYKINLTHIKFVCILNTLM